MMGEHAGNNESEGIEFKNGGEHVTFTNASGSRRGVGRLEDLAPSLETDAEHRARKRSHWVIYITTFVMSIGFSIILTGVWPYLKKLDPDVSKEYLGWVVAANPLGQMLMSPILGFWANKLGSNRPAFFCTVFMFIVGNALYSILSVFGSSAKIIMIVSRFIVGVSSANITLCRSYIAASSTLRERTTAVSLTSAAQSLGFVVGPALQTAIAVSFSHSSDGNDAVLNCTLKDLGNSSNIQNETIQGSLGIEWDMFTAAGWIASLLGFTNLILFAPCIFKEYNIAEKEAKYLQRERNEEERERKLPKADYPAVVCVLGAFFVILLVFVLLETIAVPMVIDMYAWTSDFAVTIVGVGMSIVAFITLFMFALGSILAKKYDERKVMIFLGLVPTMLSMLIHFPMGSNYARMQNCTTEQSQMAAFPVNIATSLAALNNSDTEESIFEAELSRHKRFAIDDSGRSRCGNTSSHYDCHLGCPQDQEWCLYTPIVEVWQMALADVTAVIGYPVAFAILSSLYTKILGPKPLGLWMGILTSVGSFSRTLGPIFVSYMYTELGTRWTFGTLFAILAITVLGVSLMYKRLVPMKVDMGEQAEPLQD